MAASVCLLSALGLTLTAPGTGLAEPKPTEKQLLKELDELNKKVDRLIETYAAKRESVRKAEKAEKVAEENLRKAQRTYDEAWRQVDSIAQIRYQSSSSTLPSLLFADSGGMNAAAVMEHLIAQQSAYLEGFATSRDRRKQAADRAEELTEQRRKEAEEVERQRKEAEKVIRDIKRKLDQLVPLGSGRRAGGWAPQLPTGADNITDRTRNMRDTIRRRFDLTHTVGCYRSLNDGGEHPLGRACDFMMSTGGAMPTAANLKLGDEIAAWTIKHRNKLGVKYVIWRQRINHGSGWRFMSDRGGNTANHYDHVHISMY
ncbi:coiled-coil domain-containing protein [Planomonospora corallina]|uniref:Coiled-coil domain-containing protein n=1 Tax=Planomonospora corallina TaxID=1806052 RepID=A0ABV8IHU4_9ACTN